MGGVDPPRGGGPLRGGVTPPRGGGGKWLDQVDEMCLKQLQKLSKMFHPLYLAISLPIHHYGGGLRRPPTVVDSIMVDGERNG